MLQSVRITPALFILVLTTSCQKDKEMPEPNVAPPVQEANVSFTYAYPGENKGQTFLAHAPTGKLSSNKLTLVFEKEVRPNGLGTEERVDFLLPKSNQQTGLVGTYTLASQPDPGQGDVLVTYERPVYAPGVFLNKYSSNTHVMEGSFTITEYNAGRQLISGSYTFTIKQGKDPFTYLGTSSQVDSRRACEIHGYGSFKEIPLL